MENKTYKTAVVIIPPDSIWQPIQAIRQLHDRHIRRWMPHITLIYPFRPKDQFDTLAELFAPACGHIRPFEIDLAAFKTFRHPKHKYTLWLAPEPTDQMVELQTALWNVVRDCDEVRRYDGGFTPHLSVGQVQGDKAAETLLGALQGSWTALRFTLSEICFIWRNDPPDDVFRVAHCISLGSGQ